MDQQQRPPVILTVDWEDWFHICDLHPYADVASWSSFESRIERNTDRLLELLRETRSRATFFVIGQLARQFPHVVKAIQSEGHELAWHGETHHTWKTLSECELRAEWLDGIRRFRDDFGIQPLGFRAPMWSLTPELLFRHMSELVELGLRYDASLVPVSVVGDPNYPRTPTRIGELIELPPTIVSFFGITAPVSMSWGFRWLPWWYVRWQLSRSYRKRQYLMVAIHPWELDVDQPRLDLSRGIAFSHYAGLGNTRKRLRWLLRSYPTLACEDAVNGWQNSGELPRFTL